MVEASDHITTDTALSNKLNGRHMLMMLIICMCSSVIPLSLKSQSSSGSATTLIG